MVVPATILARANNGGEDRDGAGGTDKPRKNLEENGARTRSFESRKLK